MWCVDASPGAVRVTTAAPCRSAARGRLCRASRRRLRRGRVVCGCWRVVLGSWSVVVVYGACAERLAPLSGRRRRREGGSVREGFGPSTVRAASVERTGRHAHTGRRWWRGGEGG